MKLKVCGMKYVENMLEVAALQPDYLGFIFYEKSKRNFEGVIPKLPKNIKKTGVFVNEHMDIIVSLIEEYQLEAVQLHGDESVEYIMELKSHVVEQRGKEANNLLEIIKVFSIDENFNFEILSPFEDVVDYFLFDTKGKERGGNGITFDWKVLEKYPSKKPFFLSGGIGLSEVSAIKEIAKTDLPIYALDVNSKFEESAGMKSVKQVKQFKKEFINF